MVRVIVGKEGTAVCCKVSLCGRAAPPSDCDQKETAGGAPEFLAR